jgi:hypothetical protein
LIEARVNLPLDEEPSSLHREASIVAGCRENYPQVKEGPAPPMSIDAAATSTIMVKKSPPTILAETIAQSGKSTNGC